jgi:transposase-like protein
MIQIDGTFLYGKYQGTLLIATAQDGNSNILPIAFAIVEYENTDSWSWFLKLIRRHVTQKQGICLISDRHAGIKAAVAASSAWKPPNAYHVYCIRHIASNFNHKFKNTKLKEQLILLGKFTVHFLIIHYVTEL